MAVILVISIVIVIGGTAAATRLSSIQVRRRRKLMQVLSAALADPHVSRMPRGRGRAALPSTRFRHPAPRGNVEILADYRKARASGFRQTRAAAGGVSRGPQRHRPEPA